jgi:hypothetical protein
LGRRVVGGEKVERAAVSALWSDWRTWARALYLKLHGNDVLAEPAELRLAITGVSDLDYIVALFLVVPHPSQNALCGLGLYDSGSETWCLPRKLLGRLNGCLLAKPLGASGDEPGTQVA